MNHPHKNGDVIDVPFVTRDAALPPLSNEAMRKIMDNLPNSQPVYPASPVGDLNSSARGSGARFNSGKTPYDLVPLVVLGQSMLVEDNASQPGKAMILLGKFQATHNVHWLYAAMAEMGSAGWEECARVFEYGMKKYAAWNWAKGMAWSVPLACASRHLLAIHKGEAIDPESMLAHRGHVFCNLVMLIAFSTTYPEGNDLPPKELL